MGSTGELSTECSKLKADMASNTEAQEAATNIRKKEKKAYVALKADSEQGVAQMTQALEKLSEVGADQTMSEGADHAKFMAGYGSASLLKLQTQVKKALLSASSFLPAQKVATVCVCVYVCVYIYIYMFMYTNTYIYIYIYIYMYRWPS